VAISCSSWSKVSELRTQLTNESDSVCLLLPLLISSLLDHAFPQIYPQQLNISSSSPSYQQSTPPPSTSTPNQW
jgi:hypothetical protein